jgi:hypothetical protein
MRHLRYRNAGIALQQRNYAGIKIVQFASSGRDLW